MGSEMCIRDSAGTAHAGAVSCVSCSRRRGGPSRNVVCERAHMKITTRGRASASAPYRLARRASVVLCDVPVFICLLQIAASCGMERSGTPQPNRAQPRTRPRAVTRAPAERVFIISRGGLFLSRRTTHAVSFPASPREPATTSTAATSSRSCPCAMPAQFVPVRRRPLLTDRGRTADSGVKVGLTLFPPPSRGQ